jgi:PilZ domain
MWHIVKVLQNEARANTRPIHPVLRLNTRNFIAVMDKWRCRMEAAIDYRRCKRFSHQSTILLEDEIRGSFSYGRISNMSGDGMYFETEFAFRLGTRVRFRLDDPPFKSCPAEYCGIVKWCNELHGDTSNYLFGVGVEFC